MVAIWRVNTAMSAGLIGLALAAEQRLGLWRRTVLGLMPC